MRNVIKGKRIIPIILLGILIILLVTPLWPWKDTGKGDTVMARVSLIVGDAEHGVDATLGVLLPDAYQAVDYAHKYILEILGHAKLPFQRITYDAQELSAYSAVVIPGNLSISQEMKAKLTSFVEEGGYLIGIGGTSGLDQLFGVKTQGYAKEGYIKILEQDNRLVSGMESSLHIFRGSYVSLDTGASLAKLLDENHEETEYHAIVHNNYGKGECILYASDIVYSILRIQQGIRITQDGIPAPDGTAPIDDGILKTDDGIVLDWEWDRDVVDDAKFFVYPIADELRELILKGIFYAFSAKEEPLPMVWYWKDGLEAVGLISHDSDGNVPSLAQKLHENLMDLGIKSTWCIQYPGGYSAEFYDALKKTGYEIALHYDAMTGQKNTTWNHDDFRLQDAWLRKESKTPNVISNKNHYLRWEGYLEFFHWLEEAGIEADQTKGPSKKGNVGFIFGGSHPWTPMDETDGSFIDVLEINLATQDLVLTCPYVVGPTVVDKALKHNGIAHFLFHPAHVLKPGIADAMKNVVNYGRDKGLQWFTSGEINHWERFRRHVVLGNTSSSEKDITFTVKVPSKMDRVTLRLMAPSNPVKAVKVNGKDVKWELASYLGFDFIQIVLDMDGEANVSVAF